MTGLVTILQYTCEVRSPYHQIFFKKRLLILVLLSLFFFLLCGVVQGETSGDIAPACHSEARPPVGEAGRAKAGRWQNIETKYTIVRYQSLEGLKKFNHKIRYGQERWGLRRLFSTPGSDEVIDKITKKVDILFERVQEILDMRKKMNRVTINIYHNKKQLHDAYSRIYKKSCRIRAWYRYKNNTVYINVDDLHERMLAHELAHAIIDHYLLVRPPPASAEILARYVDRHLKD
jgi:hypothetical protein